MKRILAMLLTLIFINCGSSETFEVAPVTCGMLWSGDYDPGASESDQTDALYVALNTCACQVVNSDLCRVAEKRWTQAVLYNYTMELPEVGPKFEERCGEILQVCLDDAI